MIHPFFQKSGVFKKFQPFGFLNWRMPRTHSAWIDRVQKTKYPCKKVRFIHFRVKSLSYTKSE
jgi:hypothetical protein